MNNLSTTVTDITNEMESNINNSGNNQINNNTNTIGNTTRDSHTINDNIAMNESRNVTSSRGTGGSRDTRGTRGTRARGNRGRGGRSRGPSTATGANNWVSVNFDGQTALESQVPTNTNIIRQRASDPVNQVCTNVPISQPPVHMSDNAIVEEPSEGGTTSRSYLVWPKKAKDILLEITTETHLVLVERSDTNMKKLIWKYSTILMKKKLLESNPTDAEKPFAEKVTSEQMQTQWAGMRRRYTTRRDETRVTENGGESPEAEEYYAVGAITRDDPSINPQILFETVNMEETGIHIYDIDQDEDLQRVVESNQSAVETGRHYRSNGVQNLLGLGRILYMDDTEVKREMINKARRERYPSASLNPPLPRLARQSSFFVEDITNEHSNSSDSDAESINIRPPSSSPITPDANIRTSANSNPITPNPSASNPSTSNRSSLHRPSSNRPSSNRSSSNISNPRATSIHSDSSNNAPSLITNNVANNSTFDPIERIQQIANNAQSSNREFMQTIMTLGVQEREQRQIDRDAFLTGLEESRRATMNEMAERRRELMRERHALYEESAEKRRKHLEETFEKYHMLTNIRSNNENN
ncbi:uncharacterized protein EV154DRAFT_579123 [Mucor mucedo]|uniref:uncharacterized protein n=1 Tax=Mucor mucedo TaxID=29922 RepID=UPI00221F4D88|nr:uncharacterized protein EV154DRAFT_579123 [Mucor mucedo]KAI7873309.1 hypothetical protein EV154DRAFT_579123 [Mucor mucedo]